MPQVYDTLLDVPVDQPGVDADDRLVPAEVGVPYEPVEHHLLLLNAPLSAQNLAVPFFRLDSKSSGKPVVALNRALSRADYRKWQAFSGTWNPWVTKALKNFQKDHKLAVTGVYNRDTHVKLARYYDAYAIKYLLKASIPPVDKNMAKSFLRNSCTFTTSDGTLYTHRDDHSMYISHQED
jgi:hypothetical protein